jgi:hypothetical protein
MIFIFFVIRNFLYPSFPIHSQHRALSSPNQAVESICTMLQNSPFAEIFNDHVHIMQQLFFQFFSRFAMFFYDPYFF